MQTVNTGSLELGEGWLASDPDRARVRFTFPMNAASGAEGSAIVYFELEPGKRLATHTDSAEEILYIVSGTAEAEVGDERGQVSAGDLALIPALVPHGLRNTGDETVRVVGFFCESEITSRFDEPMQPINQTVIEQAVVAAAA
ncbi:MAG: cupin domain-containing protein [Thermoleophilaceae bacterium]